MTLKALIAVLVWSMCATAAAQQMRIPNLDKDQEIAALKAKLAVAEMRVKQAQEVSASVQPTNSADRIAARETATYEVDRPKGYEVRVTEWRSQLDRQIICTHTTTAVNSVGSVSCVRR